MHYRIHLGLVVLFSSNYIVPEKIYPWLSVFSAILVTGMGIWLFLRSYRNLVLAPHLGDDALLHHGHSHHSHDSHSHDHSHPHTHEHDDKNHKKDKKMRTWDLFTLGIAGGIIPCPDAIVILLIGVALNRIVYGLVIILAFGMGLATVLISIGILVVTARSFIQKFTGKNKLILYQLPILSSIIIVIIGIMLGINALFG